MCTVSIVPLPDMTVCSFNRDEQPARNASDLLVSKKSGDKWVVFSRDTTHGGPWFCADNKGNICMLFNGAFANHQRKETKHKSRGLVLLEIISAQDPLICFKESEFQSVEPYSVISVSKDGLLRLTWDGKQKYITPLDKHQPYIFSSATLYTNHVVRERKKWFMNFLDANNQLPAPEKIFGFHREYQESDSENGLVIKRPNGISTLSISQAILYQDKTVFLHHDIVSGKSFQTEIIHS